MFGLFKKKEEERRWRLVEPKPEPKPVVADIIKDYQEVKPVTAIADVSNSNEPVQILPNLANNNPTLSADLAVNVAKQPQEPNNVTLEVADNQKGLPTAQTEPSAVKIPNPIIHNAEEGRYYHSNTIQFSVKISKRLLDYLKTKKEPRKFVRLLISKARHEELKKQGSLEQEDEWLR